MDDIIIREVRTARDLGRFIRFPCILYKKNRFFVPALFRQEKRKLDRERNPAFEYCQARYWLAEQKGRVVGRIAAIYNPLHEEVWGRKLLRFGWFDFTDNPGVSAGLLSEAEKWARALGCEGVHGPFGFTYLDRKGFLIDGFDRDGSHPTLYNFAYYRTHLEAGGYGKEIDWVEYMITVPGSIPEKVHRIQDMVLAKSRLQILSHARFSELKKYADEAFALLNLSYRHVYGYTELTPSQVRFYRQDYFRYISRRFTKMVFNERKELIAFALSRPSMTKILQKTRGRLMPWHLLAMLHKWKKNDHLIMYFIAVRPDFINKGVAAIIFSELTEACIAAGIKTAETGEEIETDMALRGIWKNYGNTIHKTRRSFIKLL
ncbi:MAG: GCN5 family acetyltransferase [Spirochaetales bacterium]|nr:GCN5 family acetyltransferase [Spirochaetales bacterium]